MVGRHKATPNPCRTTLSLDSELLGEFKMILAHALDPAPSASAMIRDFMRVFIQSYKEQVAIPRGAEPLADADQLHLCRDGSSGKLWLPKVAVTFTKAEKAEMPKIPADAKARVGRRKVTCVMCERQFHREDCTWIERKGRVRWICGDCFWA